MFKKIWKKIKDAIQSPPGQFIAALCGAAAIGSLAHKAASSKDRKRIAGGGNTGIDTDSTRDTINTIQQQQRSAIAGNIGRIEGILSDIGREGIQDNRRSIHNARF